MLCRHGCCLAFPCSIENEAHFASLKCALTSAGCKQFHLHGLKIEVGSRALLETNGRAHCDWSFVYVSLCASGSGLIRQCVRWAIWFV